MKYTIFNTKFGFFGILTKKNGILRTSLPTPTRRSAENYLLEGLTGAKFDAGLLPDLQSQIKSYFTGTYVDFDTNIPLLTEDLSQFTQDILKACINIQYGQTASYADLAKNANHPKAARPTGSVMAKNPIPLIIPCHRVIKSDGKTGGFQQNRPGGCQQNRPGGPDLKKRMLHLESPK